MNSSDLNQYWKTVVDTIQDGVMIVDTDGVIISVNRGFEETTGFSAHEVQDRYPVIQMRALCHEPCLQEVLLIAYERV